MCAPFKQSPREPGTQLSGRAFASQPHTLVSISSKVKNRTEQKAYQRQQILFLSRLLESPYSWELEASQTTQRELSHLISSRHPNTQTPKFWHYGL